MEAQELRERLLTGGRSLRGFVLTAYVVVGLILVDVVLDLDQSELMWFEEDDEVLYCTVRHDTSGRPPGVAIVSSWVVTSHRALATSCRYHHPDNVSAEAIEPGPLLTTRLGITRLELRHDRDGNPGCVEITGGLLDRIRTEACVEERPGDHLG